MPYVDPWTGQPVGYDEEDPYIAAAKQVLSPYVGMGGGGGGGPNRSLGGGMNSMPVGGRFDKPVEGGIKPPPSGGRFDKPVEGGIKPPGDVKNFWGLPHNYIPDAYAAMTLDDLMRGGG